MSKVEKFPGLAKFLFESPLYQQVKRPITDVELKSMEIPTVDGYYPACEQMATFKRLGALAIARNWGQVKTGETAELLLHCTRKDSDAIRVIVLFLERTVQKIGQYP